METVTRTIKVKRIIEGENEGKAQELTFNVRVLAPSSWQEGPEYFNGEAPAFVFFRKAIESAQVNKGRGIVAPANKKDEPISRAEFEALAKTADTTVFGSIPGVSLSEVGAKAMSTVANVAAELQAAKASGKTFTNEELLAMLNA